MLNLTHLPADLADLTDEVTVSTKCSRCREMIEPHAGWDVNGSPVHTVCPDDNVIRINGNRYLIEWKGAWAGLPARYTISRRDTRRHSWIKVGAIEGSNADAYKRVTDSEVLSDIDELHSMLND